MKLGKLPNLPWYLRLVVFLFVGGLLYAGFWYFITSGTRAETKTMEEEIAQLRPRNARLQIVSQNH
jgi:membrane protein implicated in regulation of membrane protease activity